MASYTFRWPYAADEVFVTGTFDDWGRTVRLDKHGEVFEKNVSLPEVNDKLHYKFVVDGLWTTDTSAPEENDGSNNINNVLYSDLIHNDTIVPPHSDSDPAAMLASNSTTAALGANVPKEAEQVSTMSSAAPDSTSAYLARYVPLESKGNVPGTFPETPSKEPEEFSVNPIPASEGASNPVKLQPGERVPDTRTTHANTTGSTVRTDPGGYEQDASAPLAGLPTAVNPATLSNPSSSQRQSKIIPESGLPVNGERAGLTDTGMTVNSAAPAATTAGLAGGVPFESQKQQSRSTNGGGGAVSDVPGVVRSSISEAHRDPEAAASKEAVKEKKELEDELRRKVKLDESAGTPGPTTSAAATETAPVATGTSAAAGTSTTTKGTTPGAAGTSAARKETAPVATGDQSQSAQLSPRSTPPPEPTVTTGVASSRTPQTSASKGVSSEGQTATAGAAGAAGSKASQGHSGLTGPPGTAGTAGSKSTDTAGAAGSKQTDTAGAAGSKQTDTAGGAESKAAGPNGNGNGPIQKDHVDKAKQQAGDAAKDQVKKKGRASGLLQKLKAKLK